MNIAKQVCAVALMGLMASTATVAEENPENQWYIGAGLGISEVEPDTSGSIYSVEDSRDSGYLLYLGYDLFDNISIEGHYTDLGEAVISPTGKIDYQIFGLGGLYYFYDEDEDHKDLSAFLKAGLGVMKNSSDLKFERQNDGHIFFGAGLEYAFDNGFALRTELDLYDEDAKLLSVSLLKRFGSNERKTIIKDDDQDGVINSNDRCPATARGVTVNTNGCEPDGDQDGVIDRVDQCLTTPMGSRVDTSGCELDGDRDGVVDSQDQCPTTPRGAQVDIAGCELDGDQDGVVDSQDQCPDTEPFVRVDSKGCALDRDMDGIPDIHDKCPDSEPSVRVDSKGCALDRDMDGIPDIHDKCPDSEPFVRVDSKGCALDSDKDGILNSHDKCPDSEPFARVDSRGCVMAQVIILKGVLFETGSAQLKEDSKATLNPVAETLKRYPAMVVEVAGYTDSRGSRLNNEQLSARRAKSVVSYLISMGVNGGNMIARGYGPVDPVADNATAAGRAKNRRVELHILKR
jgi:outer membrane protein OmpA-like peptidoglycan-associated protein